jgi:hypothetical protein
MSIGMSRRRAIGCLLILLLLLSSAVPAKETPVEKEDHKGNDVATSVLHDIHRCRRSTDFLDAPSQSLQGKERAGAAVNSDFRRRERRSPTVDLWHTIRDGFLLPGSSRN